MNIDNESTIGMLKTVCTHLVDNVDLLTDADLAIGDGDHGIGMRRGFTAAFETLEKSPPSTIELTFKAVGMAILSKTGGAAGAIFGTFFLSGAKVFANLDTMSGDSFASFLENGLEAVIKRGGVTEGQKTMIDVLAPASRQARISAADGLSKSVAAAVSAASDGVEATKNMIATTGKARSLGERSLGHPDPGAISVHLILQAMDNYLTNA